MLRANRRNRGEADRAGRPRRTRFPRLITSRTQARLGNTFPFQFNRFARRLGWNRARADRQHPCRAYSHLLRLSSWWPRNLFHFPRSMNRFRGRAWAGAPSTSSAPSSLKGCDKAWSPAFPAGLLSTAILRRCPELWDGFSRSFGASVRYDGALPRMGIAPNPEELFARKLDRRRCIRGFAR